MTGDRPLTVWAVSDGRAGIQNQVVGLAEAVARLTPAEITIKRVGYRLGVGRLPEWANIAPRLLLAGDPVAPPWPHLWIAAGRATLPLSRRMRRWSGGRSLVVQAQDPGASLDDFDLVIPPRHDGVAGANVVAITGAPNRITPERLAADRQRFAAMIDGLTHPRVAVLIGGRSRHHDLPLERARALAGEVDKAVRASGGSAMTTLSRRTPDAARDVIRDALAPLGPVHDGEGDNPYFAFLGAADTALVTADSANMLTEAATAGLPTLMLALPGGAPKFERLHAELAALAALRPFEGRIETWDYAPLRETDRAAAEILRRLTERPR